MYFLLSECDDPTLQSMKIVLFHLNMLYDVICFFFHLSIYAQHLTGDFVIKGLTLQVDKFMLYTGAKWQ